MRIHVASAGPAAYRGQYWERAFTMIEIALSLAVIGFALVAIIGVLPLGMSVQRENREETIINQDAGVFMDAIRSGSRGMDDLTNYVLSITNIWVEYNRGRGQVGNVHQDWFTPTGSSIDPTFPLTNGLRIIGLLSRPKYVYLPNTGGFVSNQVVANVRAMSGAASDKYPQTDPNVRDMALTYRMISEVVTYGMSPSGPVTNNAWDPGWVNYGNFSSNTAEYAQRALYADYATNLQNNLHDVRLIFRWPVLPNGTVANAGRQVFCTSVAGRLMGTNELQVNAWPRLFFFDPSTFTTNAL